MKARYPGWCARTGKPYPAGTEIERAPSGGGWQMVAGQPGAAGFDRTNPKREPGPGEEKLVIGEGYGGMPFVPGDTIRWNDRQGQRYITVLSSWSRYYHEDGMTFGVGDESGHIYFAIVRPATDEESAPLRQQAARAERGAQLESERRRLFDPRQPDAEYPWGPDNSQVQVDGDWIKIGKGFNIYGGGEELCVESDARHIWLVHGNGADGDDWSRNNTTAGIGWRFPLTDERQAWLVAYIAWSVECREESHASV